LILTAFQDGRRVLEETSQHSISELTRSLRRLLHTFDRFVPFTKLVLNPADDPENPEGRTRDRSMNVVPLSDFKEMVKQEIKKESTVTKVGLVRLCRLYLTATARLNSTL